MKYWTYGEILTKVQSDLGMEDEDFIKPPEWLGYCNEGIEEAERIVHTIYEDYFLTYMPFALVNGQAVYDMPENIFLSKIRGFIYNDGNEVYPIRKSREFRKFERIEYIRNNETVTDLYKYILINKNEDLAPSLKLNLIPESKETWPTTTKWVSGTKYYEDDIIYYRENKYQSTLNPLWITLTAYIPFDKVVYNNRNYECLNANSDIAFTPLNWTDLGVFTPATTFTPSEWTDLGAEDFRAILWYIREANKMVDEDSICDIPDFVSYVMQYMKCEARKKEYNGECPPSEQRKLDRFEGRINDTLTDRIPDSDTRIEADLTHYHESV